MVEKDRLIYWISWAGVIILALIPFLWSHGDAKYIDLLPPLGAIILAVMVDHWNDANERSSLRKEVIGRLDTLQGDATKSFSGLHGDITSAVKLLHDEVAANCNRAIAKSNGVTAFSMQDAHHYVALNAQRAETIYNTRLARRDYEARAAGYWEMRDRQDRGIKDAVVSGLIYHLVYDLSQADDITQFITAIMAEPHRGVINHYPVEVQGTPLLQFIVLKYSDYSECLLGYGAGDEIANAETIFLIRSDAVCEYLIQVFNVYRRLMTPPTSGKQPEPNILPIAPPPPPSSA
jgi:hypothetical protein